MAKEQYTPGLNSLRPGYAIIAVKDDAVAQAGGDVTFIFDQPFAKVPEMISTTAISAGDVVVVTVKELTTSQIVLNVDAAAGTGGDIEVQAIVQGCVS